MLQIQRLRVAKTKIEHEKQRFERLYYELAQRKTNCRDSRGYKTCRVGFNPPIKAIEFILEPVQLPVAGEKSVFVLHIGDS